MAWSSSGVTSSRSVKIRHQRLMPADSNWSRQRIENNLFLDI